MDYKKQTTISLKSFQSRNIKQWQTNTQTHKRETDRQTDRQTSRQADTNVGQTERQTGISADRQTDSMQTDRHADLGAGWLVCNIRVQEYKSFSLA